MGNLLVIPVVGIPLVVALMERAFFSDIPERHHKEHDTYTVPHTLADILIFVMVFMGVLGVVAWWLCRLGIFPNDPVLVLSFFCSFLVTLSIIWGCANRYRVVTFDDRLVMRPMVGASKVVMYSDVERMTLTPMAFSGTYNNLNIYAYGTQRLTIWGALDVEQMLLRINRFDVLES